MSFAAETYKRITGIELPKPFGLRTPEERMRDRDRFLTAVASSSDDEAVDDLFCDSGMTPTLRHSAIAEDVTSNAA